MPHHIEKKMLWRNGKVFAYMLIIANKDMCGIYWSRKNHKIVSLSDIHLFWNNTIDIKVPEFDAITNIER